MKNKFKVPMQTEVEAYMQEKKGWPLVFCKHYAEKFWNHYQASGWKLSSGNAIKDWKACFNAQWQTVKFKEDIELLNACQGKVAKMKVVGVTDAEKLDEFLKKYAERPTDIAFREFAQFFDFMKYEKLLRPLSPEEIASLRKIYENDNQKCRSACVQMTLDGYVNTGFTVADVLNLRKRVING